MTTLTLQMPESAFSSLRRSPEEFAQEMRITAAVKWYELSIISQEKAAEIAGLSRSDFIATLNRFNVSPFQITEQELDQDP